MDGKIPSEMNLQKLFTLSSKYYEFKEQEKAFY